MAWPPVPAMATRSEQFDEMVLDAASRMENHASTSLGDLEFAVEDVPPSDPAPWESSEVPLGRLFAAQGKMPARIVVYRRPVETRTNDSRELAALINDVIVEQVASLLGVDPHELDAGYDPDES
jgi:predicted Zn-dependent protease with MMP-like domain